MKSSIVVTVVLLIVLALSTPAALAGARTTHLNVAGSIDVEGEIDSYPVNLVAGWTIEVEAICGTPTTLDPMATLKAPGGDVVAADDDNRGPGGVDCGGAKSSLFQYTVLTTGDYTLEISGVAGPTGPYTATVIIIAGQTVAPAAPGVFSGPGLPAGSNLVLFLADTPILTGPDGLATGRVIAACKTAFVLETTDGFSRLFVQGGWVPADSYMDVAESYGQPGGEAIYSWCVGR